MTDSGLTIRQADGAAQEVASDLLRRFFAEEGLDTPADRQHAGLAATLDDPRCAILLAWRAGAPDEPVRLAAPRTVDAGVDVSVGAEALPRVDAPVGIACTSWTTSVEHVRVAEIGELYVTPAERGRGVATALVAAVAAWAYDQGCTACRVAVGPEGELSHGVTGFFTARGFEPEYRNLLSRALRAGDAGSGGNDAYEETT